MIKATVVPISRWRNRWSTTMVWPQRTVRFAHLDLSFKFYSLNGEVNGVLGQTYGANYKNRIEMGVEMPVLRGRGEREFASSGLFTTNCAASRFVGQFVSQNLSISDSFENIDLKCSSEENGRGVVCKRWITQVLAYIPHTIVKMAYWIRSQYGTMYLNIVNAFFCLWFQRSWVRTTN